MGVAAQGVRDRDYVLTGHSAHLHDVVAEPLRWGTGMGPSLQVAIPARQTRCHPSLQQSRLLVPADEGL